MCKNIPNHKHPIRVSISLITYLLTILLLTLTSPAKACPHMLNWQPKPPEQRAAKAPIVLVGYATKLHDPNFEGRYEIDFKIIRVLKGQEYIAELPTTTLTSEGIYRISNFGSMAQCLADVVTEQVYMVFTQVVDDHLSAHYSDIFGAIEVWTMQMEDRTISHNFGYMPWSQWSACSESCGQQGIQIRSRACSKEECDGHNIQKRKCNQMPCENVKDIVDIAMFSTMSKGVISLNVSSHMVYDLTPNFYGQISAAKIFTPLWPTRFSVIARIRPRKTKWPRMGQYLFSIADSSGRQYFGLKVFPRPTLEILHSSGRMTNVAIPLPYKDINDGEWHQFAFGVDGDKVNMYYNCIEHTTRIIEGSTFIPNVYRTSMIVGTRMFSMERGANERYEGALSQMVMTDDPQDAALQCTTRVWGETVTPKVANSPRDNPVMVSAITQSENLVHWEWSAWGPCSVSCGFGISARRPYCNSEDIPQDDCIPYYVPRIHTRNCHAGQCPDCNCENGGLCIEDEVCECPDGWTGDRCQTAVCEQGCVNGVCESAGVCKCALGWSGQDCKLPLCFPLCRNGGVCTGYNQCTCPEGYEGRFCTEKITEIKCTRKCKNGGECIGYNMCKCQPGWRGSRCHKPDPVCEGGCANDGRCIKNGVCKCKRGYSGPNCASDVCGNCRHGGVCNTKTKQCTCPQDFTGSLCQYAVQEELCSRSPCQNVGKCIGFNKCYCPEGWFGMKCEYRKCTKYKVRIELQLEKETSLLYKLEPCDENPTGRCRVPTGSKKEKRPRLTYKPDYTECDDES